MTSYILSLKRALRGLRRHPVTRLLLIALIGLSCGIASVLLYDATALSRPNLPYSDSKEVLRPILEGKKGPSPDIPISILRSWSTTSSLIFSPYSYLAGAAYRPSTSGPAMKVIIVTSQPNLFSILGRQPSLGRSFDLQNSEKEVVLSNAVWIREFGGNPDVIGQGLLINGQLHTVVGVMGSDFYFPAEIHEPTVWVAQPEFVLSETTAALVVGRMQPGTSKEAAVSQISRLGNLPKNVALHFMSYSDVLRQPLSTSINAMRAIGLMLWITALIIALGMLVTSMLGKSDELSLIVFLGGSITQIASVILAETIVLCLPSCVISLGSAYLVHQRLVLLMRTQAPWLPSSSATNTVLLAAFLISLSEFLVICIGILLCSYGIVVRKSGNTDVSRTTKRIVNAMLIGQLSITLVIVQLAFELSVQQTHLRTANLGFQPKGLLIADLNSAAPNGDPAGETEVDHYLSIVDSLQQATWVTRAAISTSLPIVQSSNIELTLQNNGQQIEAVARAVSPGLLEMESIRPVSGQLCPVNDLSYQQRLAIINERFADSYFPGIDALGKTIQLGSEQARVIGIIANIPQFKTTSPSVPEVILCIARTGNSPLIRDLVAHSTLSILVRTHLPNSNGQNALRKLLNQRSSFIAVGDIRDFGEAVDATYAMRTILTKVFKWLAAVLLVMAIFGLYALLEYRIETKRYEIALKIALGAERYHIVRGVVADIAVNVLTSMIIGIALISISRRVIRSILHDALADHTSLTWTFAVLLFAVGCAVIPAARRSLDIKVTSALGAK